MINYILEASSPLVFPPSFHSQLTKAIGCVQNANGTSPPRRWNNILQMRTIVRSRRKVNTHFMRR